MGGRASPESIHFADFELDVRTGELRRQNNRVRLQRQPFQVLLRLIKHPGELVSRAELRQELWSTDTFVDFEQGLNAAVRRLRTALSDSADTPQFIETLPRRGYRFIAPVIRETHGMSDRDCGSSFGRVIGGELSRDVDTAAPAEENQPARMLPASAPFAALGKKPFVGREREMGVLLDALARTESGDGVTVVITGDAGMGKTALVDAFLYRVGTNATRPIVCRGESVEHSGAGEPYLPIVDALAPQVVPRDGALHEILRSSAPNWRAQFPNAYPSDQAPLNRPTPARLARELGDVFSAAARVRPVVFILEDVHWADPSTAELVRYIACRGRRSALLLIVTCRLQEMTAGMTAFADVLASLEGRDGCLTIELPGLQERSIREYLEHGFALRDVSRPLASLLSTTTEGHPLFLVSVVQLLIQRGDLERANGCWRLMTPADQLRVVVPKTIQSVVRRKLRALTEIDRRLLYQASVAGQEFSTAVLTSLAAIDVTSIEERLNAIASASGIVIAVGEERFPDGTWGSRYRFAHAVYQNVIYEDLAPTVRADVHRRIADCLTELHRGRTSEIATQLARHFKEGREPDRSFEHFMQAGDNSMTMSGGLEAESLYSQAISVAEMGDGVARRRIATAYYKRAIARTFHSNVDAAEADYRKALVVATAAGDKNLVFDVHLAIAYAHFIAERTEKAMEAAAAVRREAESSSDALTQLRYLILEIQLKIGGGELQNAARIADRTVELARSAGDLERLCFALSLRAQLAYYGSDYALALPYLQEVCSAGYSRLRRPGDPRPLNVYFHGALYLGLTLADLGEISKALHVLHSALEVARHDGYAYWVPQLFTGIAKVHAECGDYQASLDYDERAESEAMANTELRLQSRVSLAADCIGLGKLHRARELLAEAETLAERSFFYSWLCQIRLKAVAAELALAVGAVPRALEFAACAGALSRRCGLWKDVVGAEQTLAQAAAAEGNWYRASEHVEEAILILTGHHIPLIAWRVSAIAARIHRNQARDQAASAALQDALEQSISLSDRIQEEPLRIALRESFRRLAAEG